MGNIHHRAADVGGPEVFRSKLPVQPDNEVRRGSPYQLPPSGVPMVW